MGHPLSLKHFALFVITFCCLGFFPVYAEVLNPIYQAEVPVDSRSKPVWKAAIVKAFKQVLTQKVGDVSILSEKEVQPWIVHPAPMIRSYRYFFGLDEWGQKGLHLKVTFNAKGIEHLLQQVKKRKGHMSHAKWVSLKIVGINNFDAYGNLMNYMRGLKLIKRVDVLDISADEVVLKVRLMGSLGMLEQTMNESTHLMLIAAGEDWQEKDRFDLRYRYQ